MTTHAEKAMENAVITVAAGLISLLTAVMLLSVCSAL